MEYDLKRFRVRITRSDFYNVDLVAPDAKTAIQLAEPIELNFLQTSGGEWDADDAWEVPANAFDPPFLPAASWIYRP